MSKPIDIDEVLREFLKHDGGYGRSHDQRSAESMGRGALLEALNGLLVEGSAARERLFLYFNYSGVGLWDAHFKDGDPSHPDTDTKFSPEFWRILGYDKPVCENNPYNFWASRLHPDDYSETIKTYEAHINDRSGKTPFNVFYRLRRKDDSYSWYQATGGTLRDVEGNPIRAAGTMIDVTSIKEAEHAARRAEEVAWRADRAKSEFLMMASHEIRTPLNAILGFSEMFRMMTTDTRMDPEVRRERAIEYAQHIYLSGERLRTVVDHLFYINQFDLGDLALDASSTELAQLVDQAVNRAQRLHPNSTARIEFNKRGSDIWVDIDEALIEAAFCAIICNALEHCGDAPEVSLSIETNAESVSLVCLDDGPGMTEDAVNRSRMTATLDQDPTIARELGLGTGLPLAHRVADMHAGRLDLLVPDTGKGLKVALHLKASPRSSREP